LYKRNKKESRVIVKVT